MEDFKVGETVQLKSGGPKMTVDDAETLSAVRGIRCQWFAGNKLEDGYFKPESLKKISEDEKTGR